MQTGSKFEKLVKIVDRLRRECPWDKKQTHQSLKPYMVEELYEAFEAIDAKKSPKIAEELGDMLLHICMHASIGKEKHKFRIDDAIDSITRKMIRRHPHVFGNKKAKNAEEVWLHWEKIKKTEKGRGTRDELREKSILDGIPKSLPALYRAERIQKRASRVGFDWDRVAGAWDKVREELAEIDDLLNSKLKSQRSKRQLKIQKLKEEIGDLLFAIVNVTRKLDLDAEQLLHSAIAKFSRRFKYVEKVLQKESDMTLGQMDAVWAKAKKMV